MQVRVATPGCTAVSQMEEALSPWPIKATDVSSALAKTSNLRTGPTARPLISRHQRHQRQEAGTAPWQQTAKTLGVSKNPSWYGWLIILMKLPTSVQKCPHSLAACLALAPASNFCHGHYTRNRQSRQTKQTESDRFLSGAHRRAAPTSTMAAETTILPMGRLSPRTSEPAAELPELVAAGLGEVVELGEPVEGLEFEFPTRDARAGTVLKFAVAVPLVQEEPGVVLAPETKLTAAHWQRSARDMDGCSWRGGDGSAPGRESRRAPCKQSR